MTEFRSAERASQHYIASPGGVVVCFDSPGAGVLFHQYSRTGSHFENLEQLVQLMEQLYDKLQFPYAGTQVRSFLRRAVYPIRRKEKVQVMKEEELLTRHGDLGTYIIRVQQRQNSSWQGRITWVEKNKTVNFRSVWEMIRLIEGSMDEEGHIDNHPELAWDE